MDFVEYCVKYPWRIGDDFLDELRGLGFSDEQLAEAAMNVGLFLFMTTVADLYRVPALASDYLGPDIAAWEAAGAEHQPRFEQPS